MTGRNLAVSVIVPTYNRGDVILRALDSLLAQDFELEFEIIVVDDGSTDDTVEKVTNLQTQNGLIQLVKQKNAGASAARRAGILAAKADVVAFLDSDDVSEPHHLKTLWKTLHKNESVVLAYALVSDLHGKLISEQRVPEVDSNGLLADPLLSLLTNGCFTYSMNLMTYRELAVDAATGRAHILAANDFDLCLRLANKGLFAFDESVTLKIDRRDDGIGSSFGYRQVSFAVLVCIEAVKLSARKDIILNIALKTRVRSLWPTAFAQSLRFKQYKMALRILRAGLTYGSWGDLKKLYWAIDYYCVRGEK